MSTPHECVLCRSHATVELHSTYQGQPIMRAESWIITGRKGRHWFSGPWSAPTLAGIRQIIRAGTGRTWDGVDSAA